MESVNEYHKSNELIRLMTHLMAALGMNEKGIFINFKMRGKEEIFFHCIRSSGKYKAKIWLKPVLMKPVVNKEVSLCDRNRELGKENHLKSEQAIMLIGRNKDNDSLIVLF